MRPDQPHTYYIKTMQETPPNKQAPEKPVRNKWPRAKPAFEGYERACEAVTEAECRHGVDSPAAMVAREKLVASQQSYHAAVLLDEKEHATLLEKEHSRANRVKCRCGSWNDPEKDGNRCPDCYRPIKM